MYFDRLEVTNFRSIADADVRFEKGIDVVHGPNGAGKTSLLESAFFALYGSDAIMGGETLEDVIRNGTKNCEVTLTFMHDGDEYRVQRSLTRRPNSSPTHETILQTHGEAVESVTAVEERITNLLRMDADAFLSAAYIQQGEIKLIEESGTQRQRLLDRLLQLGKLETYIERSENALTGARRSVRERKAVLEEAKGEIEETDLDELRSSISTVESKLDKKQQEKEGLEKERDKKAERHRDAIEALEGVDEIREKINELEGDRKKIDKDITENNRQQENQNDEIDQTAEKITKQQRRAVKALQVLPDDPPAEAEMGDPVEPKVEPEDIPSDLHLFVSRDADDERVVYHPARAKTYAADMQEHVETLDAKISRLKDQKRDVEADANSAETDANGYQRDAQREQDTVQSAVKEMAKRMTQYREAAEAIGEREDQISTLKQQLSDRREEVVDMWESVDEVADITPTEEAIEEARAQRRTVADNIGEAKGDRKRLEQKIEEAESLLDAGKCPECGQDVEDSPHTSDLDQKRERLEQTEEWLDDLADERDQLDAVVETLSEIESTETKIENLQGDLSDKKRLRDEAKQQMQETQQETLAPAVAMNRELAGEEASARELAADLQEKADDIATKIKKVRKQKTTAEKITKTATALYDALDTLETLSERRAVKRSSLQQLEDQHDTLTERRKEKTEAIEAKRKEIDDERVRQLEKQRDKADERVSEIDAAVEEIEGTINDLQQRKGAIKETIETYRKKRERVNDLRKEIDDLERAKEQTTALVDEYKQLKTELREQNVHHLQQFTNEIFDDLYQSNTYEKIEIDADYTITVHDKAGGTLRPTQLSGGEQTMLNLSIRAAIYKLLAEGSQTGGAAALPPMILDEPTAHLDDDNRGEIDTMVEKMRDLGVTQTVVVSHQDQIISSSDAQIEVTIDESTNESQVSRQETDSIAAAF